MMSDTWYLLQSGSSPAAYNMALDETLLHKAGSFGRPLLRFYGWTEPAATFGYAQRIGDVAVWTPLRPLVRRPTGGGLVPHDADWTYTLVFPPDDPWYCLKAVESYRQVHQWIHRAFASLDVPTELAPTEVKSAPGQCFIGAERFDLLWRGAKIAGAAQRRSRQGLLVQGSVQPGACACPRAIWESAMLETASGPGKVSWTALQLDDETIQQAQQLAAEKYSQAWHNERR